MNERIEPALTPDEWFRRSVQRGDEREPGALRAYIDPQTEWLCLGNTIASLAVSARPTADRVHAIIALANAALLDDDPRKITRAMVTEIIRSAQQMADVAKWFEQGRVKSSDPGADVADARKRESSLLALADALESYLPPEK